MLGADLVGFQTQLHCNNFIETVSREIESLLDFEQLTITRQDHISHIKAFPISIAFPNPSKNKDTSLASEKSFNPFTAATKFFKGLFGGDDNSDAVDEPVPEKEVIVKDNIEDNDNQGLLAALQDFFQNIFS